MLVLLLHKYFLPLQLHKLIFRRSTLIQQWCIHKFPIEEDYLEHLVRNSAKPELGLWCSAITLDERPTTFARTGVSGHGLLQAPRSITIDVEGSRAQSDCFVIWQPRW